MTIKAVVFDLDGTIVDFNFDFKAVRAEVIQFLTKQGFPQSMFSINESVFETLKKMEIFMRNNGKGEREVSRYKESVLSIAEEHEIEAARSTSLLPGILEALKALRKMGLKIALFTVRGQKTTNYIMRTFRLKRFFNAIVARELVPLVKPNPIHLEKALKMLNVKPEEAMVVGDSVWDMKCAQELGVFAVGVLTGVSSLEELTRAGASCLISTTIELPAVIEQLNKSID